MERRAQNPIKDFESIDVFLLGLLSRLREFEVRWLMFRPTKGFFTGKEKLSDQDMLAAILSHAIDNPDSHTAACWNIVMTSKDNKQKAEALDQFLTKSSKQAPKNSAHRVDLILDRLNYAERVAAAVKIQAAFRGA